VCFHFLNGLILLSVGFQQAEQSEQSADHDCVGWTCLISSLDIVCKWNQTTKVKDDQKNQFW
jgi:hypothetical protein